MSRKQTPEECFDAAIRARERGDVVKFCRLLKRLRLLGPMSEKTSAECSKAAIWALMRDDAAEYRRIFERKLLLRQAEYDAIYDGVPAPAAYPNPYTPYAGYGPEQDDAGMG